MQGHVVERGHGEDDAGVALSVSARERRGRRDAKGRTDQVGYKQEDVLLHCGCGSGRPCGHAVAIGLVLYCCHCGMQVCLWGCRFLKSHSKHLLKPDISCCLEYYIGSCAYGSALHCAVELRVSARCKVGQRLENSLVR